MTDRYLTITLQPDWKEALRALAPAAKANGYQGEVLNFESPGHFLGNLRRSAGILRVRHKAKVFFPFGSWPVPLAVM